MLTRQIALAAATGFAIICAMPSQGGAVPSPAPASPSAAPATSHTGVDPCSMLAAPSLAAALSVGVEAIGAPQRPTPNQCLWNVAARGNVPVASSIVLVMNAAQTAKAPCRGFGCLGMARAIVGMIPGVHELPPQVDVAFSDAQLVTGLGDRASWKNGWLTVVKDQLTFGLLVQSSASSRSRLALSEGLARDVIGRLPSAP